MVPVLVLVTMCFSADVAADTMSSIQGKLGGGVTFPCAPDDLGRDIHMMFFQKAPLDPVCLNGYHSGGLPLSSPTKYSNRTRVNVTQRSLEMWDIRVSDVGEYECVTVYKNRSLDTARVFLSVTDVLFQPIISLSSSIGGVSEGQQQGLVYKDHSFDISCSIQPQYPGGSFHLTFTGSNTTLRHTHPAVNHSTNFLFPAADHTQGNYSCVYEVYIFSHNFTSESELLSVTVADSPLTAIVIRVVVVLLILVISNTTSYLFFKTTRGRRTAKHGDGVPAFQC